MIQQLAAALGLTVAEFLELAAGSAALTALVTACQNGDAQAAWASLKNLPGELGDAAVTSLGNALNTVFGSHTTGQPDPRTREERYADYVTMPMDNTRYNVGQNVFNFSVPNPFGTEEFPIPLRGVTIYGTNTRNSLPIPGVSAASAIRVPATLSGITMNASTPRRSSANLPVLSSGSSSASGGDPRKPKKSVTQRAIDWSKKNPGKAIAIGAGAALFGNQILSHAVPLVVDAVTGTNAGSAPMSIPAWGWNKGYIYNADTTQNNKPGDLNNYVVVTDPATGEQIIMDRTQAEIFKQTATPTPGQSSPQQTGNAANQNKWYDEFVEEGSADAATEIGGNMEVVSGEDQIIFDQ